MFQIDEDMTIYITRGDIGFFAVTAEDNGKPHKFKKGDVVRFKVFKKKDCASVAFQKDFAVMEETEKVNILLTEEETKIGDVISKPVDYWYEVELNPFTNPQTIIGYDDDGPKIFRLFPEGKDLVPGGNFEEIPTVDTELSLTSERPIQNRIVAKALVNAEEHIEQVRKLAETYRKETELTNARIQNLFDAESGNTDFEREISDARVGADGTVYPCAGDAIREQVRFVVETAETLRHDIDKVLQGDTMVPSNAFIDIQMLEVGKRITRDDIALNGYAWEFADIRMVSKGNTIRLKNNTVKNWFENGRHGVIVTDTNFVINEVVHVSYFQENDWQYEVKEDGYVFVYFVSEDVAYEIILTKNFVQEYGERLTGVERQCNAFGEKIGKLEGKTNCFISKMLFDGNEIIGINGFYIDLTEAIKNGFKFNDEKLRFFKVELSTGDLRYREMVLFASSGSNLCIAPIIVLTEDGVKQSYIKFQADVAGDMLILEKEDPRDLTITVTRVSAIYFEETIF